MNETFLLIAGYIVVSGITLLIATACVALITLLSADIIGHIKRTKK